MDSADAGLGGIGIFEDDHAGSGDTAQVGSRAYSVDERSEASDRFEHRPPAAAHTQSHYHNDGDSVDDHQQQGASGGGSAGHGQDDSTIQSGESGSFAVPPPRAAPKPTGNPLKDMLNAQIVNRGSSAGAPTATASNKTAGGGAAWDEEEDEDSIAAAPQKSLAAVLGGRTGQQQAGQGDDYSVASKSSAGTGAPTAGRAGQGSYEQEEEDEEGDLFSANDDPFGLFGSSKPSAFTRVCHCYYYCLFVCIVLYMYCVYCTVYMFIYSSDYFSTVPFVTLLPVQYL